MLIKNIVILGSGNLATHLAIALSGLNYNILQIYSRNIDNAKALAEKINCSFTNNIKKLDDTADLYLLIVSDCAIADVLADANLKNKLIVHSSGSTNIRMLGKYSKNYGVFYPLQSFSKNQKVDFKNIPICIEANNKENEKNLVSIAQHLSYNVNIIDSEKRLTLHLAAVFVSNFPNFFYTIADSMLEKNNLSFDLLKPLIEETTNKILTNKPINCQTGPAVRNDKNVIKVHQRLLYKFPVIKKIYTFVSKSINEIHNVNK